MHLILAWHNIFNRRRLLRRSTVEAFGSVVRPWGRASPVFTDDETGSHLTMGRSWLLDEASILYPDRQHKSMIRLGRAVVKLESTTDERLRKDWFWATDEEVLALTEQIRRARRSYDDEEIEP